MDTKGIYHILNGDALAERLEFDRNQTIVMRECMISGPINSHNQEELWSQREQYLTDTFNLEKEEYLDKSQKEITRITQIPQKSKVYLWFEDDLFCQTNMWFALYLLEKVKNIKVYLVRPNHDDWGGFGYMSSDELQRCYEHPQLIGSEDRVAFEKMWSFYSKGNYEKLKVAAQQVQTLIPRILDVIEAEMQRNRYNDEIGRPEKTLIDIINQGNDTFSQVFKEFSKIEGIYGFGDAQVKTIYDKIKERCK